jgi:hypothetical protein
MHPSAWKVNSAKFISTILHSPSPIQVATDGSKDAELAATAADLARSTGSELHKFHVGPVVPEHFEPTDVEPARMEQEARRVLEEQVTKIKNLGGTAVQGHLRMGGAAEEVVALAEGLGVGPVILGSLSCSDHGV